MGVTTTRFRPDIELSIQCLGRYGQRVGLGGEGRLGRFLLFLRLGDGKSSGILLADVLKGRRGTMEESLNRAPVGVCSGL
jgi:hypothetical protein